MVFKMKGFSPFKQKDNVKSETTVRRKNNKKISTTNTNITSDDGSSSNIKKSTTYDFSEQNYKKGKVKYKRSILKTDPEGNVTSTVTKSKRKGGTKVKTYKGKKAVRKHKRV